MQKVFILSVALIAMMGSLWGCHSDIHVERGYVSDPVIVPDPYVPKYPESRAYDTGYYGTGCSDGTREGFIDSNLYPFIAGCAGAWTIPGVHHDEGPACGRMAGNSNYNRFGDNCNVEDLCAPGWHVCYGADDVTSNTPVGVGCAPVMDGTVGPAFFLTRATSNGGLICGEDGSYYASAFNDVFGCGDLGCTPGPEKNCGPLNATSHDACAMLMHGSCDCYWDGYSVSCSGATGCNWCRSVEYYEAYYNQYIPDNGAWDCGATRSFEADDILKHDPDYLGGVLCCMDFEY